MLRRAYAASRNSRAAFVRKSTTADKGRTIAQPGGFREWLVDRASLSAGSRNTILATAEARPFRAENNHSPVRCGGEIAAYQFPERGNPWPDPR